MKLGKHMYTICTAYQYDDVHVHRGQKWNDIQSKYLVVNQFEIKFSWWPIDAWLTIPYGSESNTNWSFINISVRFVPYWPILY